MTPQGLTIAIGNWRERRIKIAVQPRSPCIALLSSPPDPGSFLGECLQNRIDVAFKSWKISHYRRPDQVSVDLEVVVDEDVPHSDNLRPRHIRILVLQLG